jgi:hypothetical protein
VSLETRSILQRIVASKRVRLGWDRLHDGQSSRSSWGLTIASVNDPTDVLVIDTGLTTWSKEPRSGDQLGAPVLKAVACVLTGLGATVVLPSGVVFDPRWYDESVREMR